MLPLQLNYIKCSISMRNLSILKCLKVNKNYKDKEIDTYKTCCSLLFRHLSDVGFIIL